MSKRKLFESIKDYKSYQAAVKEYLENQKLYKTEKYVELTIFLAVLRAAGFIHHSHHWQTLGNEFYSDHLMYQRLYEKVQEEEDIIGEKVVGVGGIELTNYHLQMRNMKSFMDAVSHGDSLVEVSLRTEIFLVLLGEMVLENLRTSNDLTSGIEQAVGNVLDTHEGFIFLLNQRNYKRAMSY